MSRSVGADIALGAPVEAVHAVLTSAAWPQALAAALRDGSRLHARTPQADGGVVLVVERDLPEGGPSFLRRLLPAGSSVVQTDSWAGDGRTGTWGVVLGGTPARLGGAMRLDPHAGGCRWVVEGELHVPVPLLGGRAESYLAPLLGRLVERQAEVLRDLL